MGPHTYIRTLSPVLAEVLKGDKSPAVRAAAATAMAKLGESVLFPHRLGSADELASMVVELLTNDYMNGEVIRVDGGIRMPPK